MTRCCLKKKFTDGQKDDARRPITIAHLEPSAFQGGNTDVIFPF